MLTRLFISTFLMIPTMAGALLYLQYVQTIILSFYKWNVGLIGKWYKKILCEFLGHDMDHKIGITVDEFELHTYTCKRCGHEDCIEWNMINKTFRFYNNETRNKTSKNS